MSSFGFTTSLLSQIAGASSTSDQFVTDLNQLAGDLESGNLSGAQQDYLTLSEDAQNGATASTASSTNSGITAGVLSAVAASPSASSAFVNELNLLGTDLGNGDLGAAQEDLLSLDGTALNAVGSSSSGTGTTGTTTGTGTTGSTTGTTTGTTATGTSAADTQELIEAAVQAIGLGDGSLVSSALSQLASLTTNATGASVLKQDSESYASGSGSSQASSLTSSLTGSQASSQTSELLQSLNSGSSSSTGSLLSVLA